MTKLDVKRFSWDWVEQGRDQGQAAQAERKDIRDARGVKALDVRVSEGGMRTLNSSRAVTPP